MAEHGAHPLVTLQDALRPLLEVEGVLGGVICTEDGLSLASALKPGLDEESLAAAGARLGQLSRNQLAGEDLEAAVLDASRLRLVVTPVSLGYLVLAADPAAASGPAVELAKQTAAAIAQTAAGAGMSEAFRP
jgi:predicted regulator of Ras-like GTPase activity (Roadblock/LC7/MglB family)